MEGAIPDEKFLYHICLAAPEQYQPTNARHNAKVASGYGYYRVYTSSSSRCQEEQTGQVTERPMKMEHLARHYLLVGEEEEEEEKEEVEEETGMEEEVGEVRKDEESSRSRRLSAVPTAT